MRDGFSNTAALAAACLGPRVHRTGPFSGLSAYSPRFTDTCGATEHCSLSSEGRKPRGRGGTWQGRSSSPGLTPGPRGRGPPTPLINDRVSGINSKPINICSAHISTPKVLRGDGRSKRGSDIQGRKGCLVEQFTDKPCPRVTKGSVHGCWTVAAERCWETKGGGRGRPWRRPKGGGV